MPAKGAHNTTRQRKKAAAAAAGTVPEPPPQHPASVLKRPEPPSSAQLAVADVQASAGAPPDPTPSLEPLPGEVWYLAFGSNMSPKVLTGRRRVKPLSSLPCTVPGYTLGFHYKGIPYLEPGFATIEPLTEKMQAQHTQLLAAAQQQLQGQQWAVDSTANHHVSQQGNSTKAAPGGKHIIKASAQGSTAQQTSSGQGNSSEQAGSGCAPPAARLSALEQVLQMVATVLNVLVSRGEPQAGPQSLQCGVFGLPLHGVAHLVKREEWEAIQQSEGVGNPDSGYQVVQVKCRLYDGEWLTAETLMAAPSCLGDPYGVLPSRRYAKILREGARYHHLDPQYCTMLDAQPSYDPSPRGKQIGSWIMGSILLSCTVWLMPLLMVLSFISRVKGLVLFFFTQRFTPYVKVKRPRTTALTKEITNPVSVRFIRAVSMTTHALHDWVLCPLLGSGYS